MKRFLSLAFICITSIASAQILNGTGTLSSANNMTCDITVNVPQNEVTIVLTGPNNVWFGFGFGGTQMFNRYSIITTGAGTVSERNLGNHNSGTLLTSSFTSVNTTVSGSIRTVTLVRPIAGLNSNYFSFPTSPGSFMMIWGKGNGSNLANHGGGNRGSSMFTLSNSCTSTTTQLASLNICQGDSTLFGANYISTAGLYRDTLIGSTGCDSIIEQNLTVSNSGPFTLSPIDICDGDSVLVFGEFVDQAGNYSDTVQNTAGCDSILTLQINVNTVMYSLNYVVGDTSMSVTATNASYQWLEDCDSSPSPIAGATGSTLNNPSSGPGSYAVIVSINGCSDTSSCINYDPSIGLSENQTLIGSFHPNPVENILTINLGLSYQNAEVSIINLEGKLIKAYSFQNGQKELTLDLTVLPKGAYLLKVNADGQLESKMILKK